MKAYAAPTTLTFIHRQKELHAQPVQARFKNERQWSSQKVYNVS